MDENFMNSSSSEEKARPVVRKLQDDAVNMKNFDFRRNSHQMLNTFMKQKMDEKNPVIPPKREVVRNLMPKPKKEKVLPGKIADKNSPEMKLRRRYLRDRARIRNKNLDEIEEFEELERLEKLRKQRARDLREGRIPQKEEVVYNQKFDLSNAQQTKPQQQQQMVPYNQQQQPEGHQQYVAQYNPQNLEREMVPYNQQQAAQNLQGQKLFGRPMSYHVEEVSPGVIKQETIGDDGEGGTVQMVSMQRANPAGNRQLPNSTIPRQIVFYQYPTQGQGGQPRQATSPVPQGQFQNQMQQRQYANQMQIQQQNQLQMQQEYQNQMQQQQRGCGQFARMPNQQMQQGQYEQQNQGGPMQSSNMVNSNDNNRYNQSSQYGQQNQFDQSAISNFGQQNQFNQSGGGQYGQQDQFMNQGGPGSQIEDQRNMRLTPTHFSMGRQCCRPPNPCCIRPPQCCPPPPPPCCPPRQPCRPPCRPMCCPPKKCCKICIDPCYIAKVIGGILLAVYVLCIFLNPNHPIRRRFRCWMCGVSCKRIDFDTLCG